MTLHEMVETFVDRWASEEQEPRDAFISELRLLLEAYGRGALRHKSLPDTEHHHGDPSWTGRFTEDELKQFLEQIGEVAADAIIPQMRKALFALCVIDGIDIWLCLQIGIALMMDKPVIVLADKTTYVPDRLRAIADVIVSDKNDTQRIEKARAALVEALRKQGLVQ